MTSSWRLERNARSVERLGRSLPAIFPKCVLVHALARPLVPPTPRLAVDSYWREHPLRADRLARALAARTGPPQEWLWTAGQFRVPPAPYREEAFSKGPGHCCVCGQPVFRYGWHLDLWADGQLSRNVRWHTACVVAWKLWTAPSEHIRALRRRQGRTCPMTRKRLLRSAEVDHIVPLYKVWRDHRDLSWPELLKFWGAPNLQAINRASHTDKSISELHERLAQSRARRAKSRRIALGHDQTLRAAGETS
jgi:5-methylcytosine-specific restriction endonuclease McrA